MPAKPESEIERACRKVLAGLTAGGQANNRPLVLAVEDGVVVETLRQELLAGAGYGVVVAVQGRPGVVRLSHRALDLVLADIGMPLLDGMKLPEVVRDKRADTPVMLIQS